MGMNQAMIGPKAVATAERRWANWRRRLSRQFFVVATLAPALLLLSVYVFFPTLYSFYLSLFKTKLFTPVQFVGLQQYATVLRDPFFWYALRNTLLYTVGSVSLTVVLGLGVALLLEGKIRGKALFRSAFFLPYVLPYAAYALLWYWLFDPGFGLVNYLLSFLGISPIPWLQSSTWVIPGFILMSVWKRLGFAMVLFMAGLQTIPDELYDAATVEGVNSWTKFRYITLPLLSPITLFVTIMSVIYSMQLFVEPFIMTKGGPGGASLSIVYLIYQQGFSSLNIALGSATAVILFVLIFSATMFLMKRFDIEDIYA